jgi:hypothetical protein
MSCDVLPPFVKPIAGNTEFTGDLDGKALASVEKLHCLPLKLGLNRCRGAMSHLPGSLSCLLLRCPSNPGQLRMPPFISLCFERLLQRRATTSAGAGAAVIVKKRAVYCPLIIEQEKLVR